MNIVWFLTVIFGLLCGAIYYLLRGKTPRQLFLYLLVGTVGFTAGHIAGSFFLPSFPLTLGDLHILEGAILSFGILRLAEWLNA
jgi:uncharacterized membrane protein YeaQ/YmgE (transglycosylase-associated protein family)